MRRSLVRAAIAVALVAVAMAETSAARQAAQNDEELARRHYELGLSFIETRNYVEALKDFQTVVDSYPTSSVAGDALLEIARYQLEVARDSAAARTATDLVLKKYGSTQAAAAAYVLSGRLAMEEGRAPADIDAALASFGRVSGLFPGSRAIPASIYYAGEALRFARRYEEAVERYRDLGLRYPVSVWTARAWLAQAICLVQLGRPQQAMAGLQRVRSLQPNSTEAAVALRWNSILYRLYVRPPAAPPYSYAGRMLGAPTTKFKGVAAIAVDERDEVLLAHNSGVSVFDAKGSLVRSIPADDPSALFMTPQGVPVVVRDGVLTPEASDSMTLSVPNQDGKARLVDEVSGAVATSRGDVLIGDKKSKAILQFAADGTYLKAFSSNIEASRLAVNSLDDVAAVEASGKSIAIFDRDGKSIGRVMAKGPTYQWGNPVDVAFDPFGHLYVLDRDRSTVLIFNPQGSLTTYFSIPDKTPGAFRRAAALGLDSAGRLYIFDEQAQHVQVYQ